MALIAPVRAAKRPQYVRGAYLTTLWRGALRASKWPRSQRRTPTAYQASLRDRLKTIEAWLRSLTPRERLPMQNAVTEHNRRVSGQRGAAATRYEDIETARANGRAWTLQLPDGTYVHSTERWMDVSDALDWISDQPGALLVRGGKWWAAPVACEPGRRLTLVDTIDPASNCPIKHPWSGNGPGA